MLATIGLACGESSAPDAARHPLEVRHRLFGRAAPAGNAAVPLPARDVVGDCNVGDEIRPALGCPTFLLERQWPGRISPGRLAERRLRVGSAAVGLDLVVERAHRGRDRDPWMPLPVLRVRASKSTLRLPFDVPAGHQTRAIVHVAPPPGVQRRVEPIVIPAEAVLVGGIGLHALGARCDVRFRIVAAVDGRRRKLLDERVGPDATRWQDYRIDLGPLAGRSVRFTFTTWPTGRGEQGVASPLWSRPIIVARADGEVAPNVIVVSLDTLRGDYVGAYGNGRVETPTLDGLAASGAYFSDVLAPFPSTTAAHMSLFTSVYPSVHGVHAPSTVLPAELRSVVETLAAHGYASAAVTENGMLLARSGFQRGFDSYREFKEVLRTMVSGHVEEVTAAGLAWIDAHRDERFFLFLHTYQVHAPYAPPPAFDRHRGPEDADLSPVENDRRAYSGEVEYTDHVLGAFVRALDDRGLGEKTIVVVTADHGEAFGEHGFVLHGSWVHDPQIRVPLILRAPGRIPAGVRSDVPVSLVDVAPTILDLVGIAGPPHIQGRTLVPLLRGGDDASLRGRPVFAEVGTGDKAALAVRRGSTKWIVRADGTVQVFDVRRDPAESVDLATPSSASEGTRLAVRHRASGTRLRRGWARAPTQASPPITPEAEQRLRALGYLE